MKAYITRRDGSNEGSGETVLMRGHSICFWAKLKKIIPKLSLLPLLSWSSVHSILKNKILKYISFQMVALGAKWLQRGLLGSEMKYTLKSSPPELLGSSA